MAFNIKKNYHHISINSAKNRDNKVNKAVLAGNSSIGSGRMYKYL